ncbi:hypothetical protein HNR03_000340 [Pseudomonas sp. JAI111]|nr:hypothetical protein [Pseudomonas sp. JAI111]
MRPLFTEYSSLLRVRDQHKCIGRIVQKIWRIRVTRRPLIVLVSSMKIGLDEPLRPQSQKESWMGRRDFLTYSAANAVAAALLPVSSVASSQATVPATSSLTERGSVMRTEGYTPQFAFAYPKIHVASTLWYGRDADRQLEHADALRSTFPALRRKGTSVVVGTPLRDGFLGGRSRYNFSQDLPPEVVEKRANHGCCQPTWHRHPYCRLAVRSGTSASVAIISGARSSGQIDSNAQV